MGGFTGDDRASVLLMIAHTFLATAAATLFAALPAAVEVNFQTVTNGAVLAVCTQALDGSFDMNNAEDLDEWGLTPGTASEEAQMREDIPGIELANAAFDNGAVLVGYIPGKSCGVHIQGRDRVATRDSLIHTMLETGIKASSSTDEDGDEVIAFPFAGHPIYVYTTTEGNIMVQVR